MIKQGSLVKLHRSIWLTSCPVGEDDDPKADVFRFASKNEIAVFLELVPHKAFHMWKVLTRTGILYLGTGSKWFSRIQQVI